MKKQIQLKNASILLIEEDKSVRASFKLLARQIFNSFFAAKNKSEANTALKQQKWDIIVAGGPNNLDNATNLYRKIKDKFGTTKIVLISDNRESAFNYQKKSGLIDAVLLKPFVLQDVLTAIMTAISGDKEKIIAQDTFMDSRPKSIKMTDILGVNFGDRILAITGFGKKYDQLDGELIEWLRANLKGSKSVVERQGTQLYTTVEFVKPGDRLIRIYQIPVELERMAKADSFLKKELIEMGIRTLAVDRADNRITNLKPSNQEVFEKANLLFENVDRCLTFRDETTAEIKSFFDNCRAGKDDVSTLLALTGDLSKPAYAEALSAIATLKKSDHNYAHSLDVGAIFSLIYHRIVEKKGITSAFKSRSEMMLSAFLHDIGKSRIPLSVLESTSEFEPKSREMELMREHPVHGAEILTNMSMPDITVNMALYHHVKKEPFIASSYPSIDDPKLVAMETKLLSIIDTYQALVGRRPYRPAWTSAKAISYISNLVDFEYDREIWNLFYQAIGVYPVGSLVELSDNSQGFVIDVPDYILEYPPVVLTRNSKGEDLKNNTLIDLAIDMDVSITKSLDPFEMYGQEAVSVFSNLNIS